MGVIGRYDSSGFGLFQRDAEVVCRTSRGLEIGSVVCPIEDVKIEPNSDGQILRRTGPEDRLIIARLERHRDKAFAACEKLIQDYRLPDVLVDVEHLFDGESVYFYFLGGVDPRLNDVTEELARTYDRKVRFRKFSEMLANGCGPTCGTGDSKCTSGRCSGCSISESCRTSPN